MNANQYDIFFKQLSLEAGLGDLLRSPEPVSGGLLHDMYAVETSKGKFAIKLLNPQILKRPEAMENYINSEKIAHLVAGNIPALPAEIIDGNMVHEIKGQLYLVFEWKEGRSLKPGEIEDKHCKEIGSILARIHHTNFVGLDLKFDMGQHESLKDWEYYLKKGQQVDAEWVGLFEESVDKLYEWDEKSKAASEYLSIEMVISHRDLDPKNVLWNRGNPTVIDWESSGFINPMQDLMETAVYWSVDGTGDLNKDLFFAFIDGYKSNGSELSTDWKRVLEAGYSAKLGWLEYNLKRSLKMEASDEEDHKAGAAQVRETIKELRQYEASIPKVLDWLYNVRKA